MPYQSERSLAELAAFVAVVESNGFSAAARASGARKATLSLRVSDLETRLGVPLLVRTTRSLRLTEEGRAYLEHARRSLAAARDADAVVTAAKSEPSGLLRVTAPGSLADMLFNTVVVAYLTKHPGVSVSLDTSMRRIDLTREGFDLAVRIGPLAESGLVARRLGKTSGGYFASPKYLEQRGKPRRPEDSTRARYDRNHHGRRTDGVGLRRRREAKLRGRSAAVACEQLRTRRPRGCSGRRHSSRAATLRRAAPREEAACPGPARVLASGRRRACRHAAGRRPRPEDARISRHARGVVREAGEGRTMRTGTARTSLGSERPAPNGGPVVSFEPLLLRHPGHRGKGGHTPAMRATQ